MAKRRGYTLIIIGLLFGVAIGFGIREVKRQIGLALMEMLEVEAYTSAGCHFVVDSIDISLLRGRAVALNPQVACEGVPHLHFKRIVAKFGLRRIRERIIDLELTLIDGRTQGFAAKSTTFKFIDSLAAPIAPERDTPDRYKVKLQRLDVVDLAGIETIAGHRVIAQGVALEMMRTPADDFSLIPQIQTVAVESDSKTIIIENVSAALDLTDEQIIFRNIFAHLDSILARGEFSLSNDSASKVTGKFSIAGDLAQLSSSITGNFSSSVALTGTADNPVLRGTVNTTDLAVEGFSANEQLSAAFDTEAAALRVSRLSVGFDPAKLNLETPLVVSATGNSGKATLHLIAPLLGHTGIELIGNLDSPAIKLKGSAASADGSEIQIALMLSNLLAQPEISGTGAGLFPGLPKLALVIERVSNGVARILLTGSEDSIKGVANVDLAHGTGDLDLSVASTLIAQQVPCGALNATAQYRWNNFAPKLGSGLIKLITLGGGCELSATTLRNPVELQILDGILHVSGISLISLGKPFSIQGTVNFDTGFDLTASGIIDLTTIRGLIPSVDELSGTGEGKITVIGPISAPSVSGSVDVRDVRLEQAKSGIEISHVTGPILIENNILTFKDLAGTFNGGIVNINGSIDVANFSQSNARITAKRFAFEPMNSLSLLASGDVFIDQTAEGARVSGTLVIDSAEFSDEITLSEVLRIIERAIISRRTQNTQSTNSVLPQVQLDLTVKGSRNILVDTNLGAAELSTDLSITGTLREPLLRGDVTVRSGWLGFQNRRFEVNSGRLVFSPPDLEPVLELTAETILPARTGENVLVILTGRGPLTAPTFSLSSDQPISERELLSLVSAGGSFNSRTRANTLGDSRTGDGTSLLEELARLHLRTFFTKLIDVDSLSISPLFNPRSGLIEPALVAEKLLADSLTLIGESTLSGVDGIARARLQLDLTDDLAVAALAEDDATRSSVPTELQITYTLLSRHARRLTVSLEGNKTFSDREILSALRLANTSLVTPQDIVELETQLKTYYAKAGFPLVSVKIGCSKLVDTCSEIVISLEENAPQRVSRIEFIDSELPPSISNATRRALSAIPKKQLATEEFRSSRVKSTINALRSEGYIAARVSGNYRCSSSDADCVLALSVSSGTPISFVFIGNTLFNSAQFLDAIRLFDRTQPFGNNTIAVLGATIERLYRERGMLFATVSYERHKDASDAGRTVYEITIDEGSKVSVSNVSLMGVEPAVRDELLANFSAKRRDELLHPSVALEEEIEANAFEIAIKLKELGFLSAFVDGKIVPIGDTNSVEIQYKIESGERSERVQPNIVNWPMYVPLPEDLTAPTYSNEMDSRGERLVSTLRSAGYLNAEVSAGSQNESDPSTITFLPGELTSIRSISVSGTLLIADKVILDAIQLRVGDPMSQKLLNAARSRLLRLGLFSRVLANTTPDGDVTFEVLERSPRSLEIGTGLNSEYGFHLFGEAADREIFGDGRQLALRLDGYYDSSSSTVSKGTASAQFRVPLIFNSNLGLSEDLRFQRFDQVTLPFDLDRWSLASFLSGENEAWTYSFGHTFLVDQLDNVDPGSILGEFDTGTVNLGFLSGTVSYDDRDAPLNPQSGFLLSLDSKLASPLFGSEANFFELSPRFSWATELKYPWGLAYQLRLGLRQPFGSTDEVPITQRYFTGGRTSVRGYKENSLGPTGASDAIQGGRYLGVQNVELRYKPVEAIAILGFVDSGSVFLDSPTLNELRHSTGLGIRYLSPVGPIGFDVGFPIARRSDEDTYRLHFSIGTIF